MRIFLGLFLFLALAAAAQDNAQEFTLKPSLGLNGCQVHGDSYDGYRKLGLFAGLAVNARLTDRASLELGFYFSQKGAKHVPTKSDASYYLLNLNYIDMPLAFRYHLNPRYFFTLGPSVAYLINHKEIRDYVDYTSSYKYNNLEVALISGLGRNINSQFQVEVRFSNSVVPVRTISANIWYPNPVARFFNKGFYNNIVTFMLTYKIGERKKSESTTEQ